MPRNLEVENLGPITRADVTFGDLTVLVGPQATGKSVFLQLLKLVVDRKYIHQELSRFNLEWNSGAKEFLTLYLGDGMGGIWTPKSSMKVDGSAHTLAEFAKRSRSIKDVGEQLFYIPAQRVMSLREGQTRPFTDYRAGDPFVLREFSQQVHALLQSEFLGEGAVFPKTNRLKEVYRDAIADTVFGKFNLKTESERLQKRIVLSDGNGESLPYLVWSAGQREFVPLLLGLYWLMPPSKTPTRQDVKWAVIEEPEMGLHPQAISVFLLLVLELLKRGYRVVLSSHSPHVLEVIWGLRFLKEHGGGERDVLDMLGMGSKRPLDDVAKAALAKDYRVYYFQRGGCVRDISALDPDSESAEESGWGGLTEFAGRVSDVVSRVAQQSIVASLKPK
jgi:energy-coupling factor transporter ATP-binding protein EcfA2